MNEFSRGDLVFDVTETGPVDGDVVVLLHGFPENRTSWDRVTPHLAGAGFRVLAPDQRGYSPRARPLRRRDYRMQELVDDVVALIDAAGVHKAHVVGHDWGGAVAWGTAVNRPDRVKTVTSLATPHGSALQRSMVTSTQLLRSWYMLFFQLPVLPELAFSRREANKKQLVATGLDPEAADRYLDPFQQPDAARAAINWYRGLPLSGRLSGRVQVPALYVYPTGDKFLGRKAADLTGEYVDAPYRFEVLEGRSHWLPEEDPETVARLVIEHARAHP